ncbi:uncharacterized protein [Penaeus vannamei]|uniref:uncharacterized protein n=1 Tax=Penaeus vannamei TaxID=6689 RepID=UPI00387F8516
MWTMSLFWLFLALSARSVLGVCYFPVEYQGIFATQSSISSISGGSVHQYSQVTILPDAIPVWGVCHKKFDNNVILRDPTGGEDCFRCFHVSLHSGNVIQVYTEGLNKCYSSEEAVLQTCPTIHDIKTKRAREIMLYKSRSFTQDGLIDRVFCPINGRYRFTYDVNDGTESTVECPEPSSELSNCPKGSQLQLRFRRCSFGELDMGLRCLGDWEGHDGQKYLALWDPEVTTDHQPRYRCAMYSVEETTGRVFLSFSIDATCTNHLHSPWDGYESMVLTPVTPPTPPAVVQTTACAFPEWAHGSWQHLQIDSNELWLQDAGTDKKYRTLCLSQHAPHGERYALYSQTQCGEEEFTCIWIKKRAVNVIEYQMASYPSDKYNASRICSDDMFRGQEWITQGRLDPENHAGCPITGEYTGVIPDAKELCARLASDCRDPQHMFYTVSSCFNSTEVYEGAGGEAGPPSSAPARHRRRAVYRASDPRALLGRGRSTRHAARHGSKRQPSWAHRRTSALGGVGGDEYTTLGAQSMPRHRHRQTKQVYVFPDEPGAPAAAQAEAGPQAQGLQAEEEEEEAGEEEEEEERKEAAAEPQPRARDVGATTTRLPYPDERPFYFLHDPKEESQWEHLRGLGPVTIEERDYRCLGQWSEGGVMYTFTHRRDVNIYECFAGVVVSSNEIFIIEAGTSCQRGLQPLAYGMKLVRQATCSEIEARESTPPPQPDPSSRPPWWPPTTKNPWVKKVSTTTETPTWSNEIPRAAHSGSSRTTATTSFRYLMTTTTTFLLLVWSSL